ncbi:MAG: hypothetical protein M1820_008869 [Bogoriella megaspora]|nr:MAG: hypothetical protein M1820_008869 [Bogoriella megaspora]
MGDTQGLAPPGSSQYSSNTLHVGDGTWDSSRDTFLLPNLVGLNFDTMRYNGMGNRFRAEGQYHNIITGHAVLAAITFLGVVPAAIFMARFYHRNPRLALRMHIWLQILTVFLVTVIFALGFFAVGPERALTNPHHGIGLTIYVLILFQFLYGVFMHRIEKGKTRYKIPLKVVLHQWLGRGIALLGITQIALGLTLYGSPKTLFILYAFAVVFLLFAWFTLSYRQMPSLDDLRSEYYTEYTPTEVTESRISRPPRSERGRHHTLRNVGLIAGAAAGIEALRRRVSDRDRNRNRSRTEVVSSYPGSRPSSRPPSRPSSRPPSRPLSRPPSRPGEASVVHEKLSDDYSPSRPRRTSWRDRLLGVGAGVAGAEGVRRWWNRRRDRDDDYVDDYRPPLGGAQSITQTDLSRVEAGQAPISPANDHWRQVERREAAQAAGLGTGSPLRTPSRTPGSGPVGGRLRPIRRNSQDSVSSWDSPVDEYDHAGPDPAADGSPSRRRSSGHRIRDAVAGLGVAALIREKWKSRREKKEDRRVQEMRDHDAMKNAQINRTNSQRFTGDGIPPPTFGPVGSRMNRRGSVTETEMSGPGPALTGSNPELSRLSQSRITAPTGQSRTDLPTNIPPPPVQEHPFTNLPPPPPGPPPQSSQHTIRDAAAAGLAGAAVGAAAADHQSSRPASQTRPPAESSAAASPASQPVSVKVKMHNDGRHVTLRRLGEEEAAQERDARRRERRLNRRRAGSLSSADDSSATAAGRWRRNGRTGMPAGQPPPPVPASATAAGMGIDEATLPPPPPGPPPAATRIGAPSPARPPRVPESSLSPPSRPLAGLSSPQQSVGGSPAGPAAYDTGTSTMTGTETSRFDSRRQRRRAERASASGASGQRVEFQ